MVTATFSEIASGCTPTTMLKPPLRVGVPLISPVAALIEVPGGLPLTVYDVTSTAVVVI